MSDISRQELAHFLRSRRARVAPADVGLPVGSRRRGVGLRREEVAVLAGVSPTWYQYLEQGRDIHPSTEVLDSVARVLGLTEDERRYVHALARRDGRASLSGDETATEIARQLVLAARESPYPVYGVNLYCDVIAWNQAATGYYADFGEMPEDRRNMLIWLLEDPEAKERLPHWRDDTRDVVARWRAQVVGRAGDGRLQALVGRLRETSSDFDGWWAAHDVQEHRSRPRHFRHPELGELAMRLIVVQAPDFAPCVVVFHLPMEGYLASA